MDSYNNVCSVCDKRWQEGPHDYIDAKKCGPCRARLKSARKKDRAEYGEKKSYVRNKTILDYLR